MLRIFRIAMGLLAVLAGLWGLGLGAYTVSALFMAPQKPAMKTDAIVVFTGGTGRIETGLNLLQAGRADRLFISGVHAGTPKADILIGWTGNPDLVEIGKESTTTTQNAAEVRGWLARNPEIRTVRLVTSNYHMNRALIEMKHAAPDIQILAHPLVQPDMNTAHSYFWNVLFGEYHKAIYRWATLLFMPRMPVHDDHVHKFG